MGHRSIPLLFCHRARRWNLALLVIADLIPATLAAQNLLTNGDFEQNDLSTYPGYNSTYDFSNVPSGQPLPGWTFYNVDLYGATHAPQSGSQFLDLVGVGPLTAAFTLQQTFATVVAATYRLDFFYGNNDEFSNPVDNPTGKVASFTASLTGSGTLWSSNFTHSGDTDTVRSWTEFTMNFVANSTSTTLTFLDTSGLPATYNPALTDAGITLDNVSVTYVLPEAGGWVAATAVIGICSAGVVTSRRDRMKRITRNSTKLA